MKAYCINLLERNDRWDRFSAQKFPFTVSRFDAVKKPNPSHGCLLSHLTLLKRCRDKEILIFEDDCNILLDWDIFYKAYSQLPKNWDMLYLGANVHQKLKRYSDNLYNLEGGWCTHGILYNKSIIPEIINISVNLILEDKNIDTFYARRIQPNYNCFIIYPLFATQFEGYSDIINNERKYDDLIPNFNKHTG